MSFRIINQNPQYRKADGTLCAGGSLTFSTTGTATAKNVFGEPGLTTNNGAVLTLNSSGQTTVDVWGTGVYRVVLKDSAAVTIWTKDNVQGADVGTITVPNPTTGANGASLLTDGLVYYFATILAVPSASGHSGKQLGNDGSSVFWEAKQTIPTYTSTSLPGGVLQDSVSFTIGKYMVKLGSGTAATTGTKRVTASITFAGTAYTATPKVFVSPTVASVTVGGANVSVATTGVSTSGFTMNAFAGNEITGNDYNIVTAVTFDYVAFGLIA